MLFFSSLSFLVGVLFYFNYTKELHTLDERLLDSMRLCSYDLKCDNFELGFDEIASQELYTLYKEPKGAVGYFPIPDSQKFVMSLTYKQISYDADIASLQTSAAYRFFATLLIVMLLSLLFSLYALHPLRSALLLTQEFIRDILHDFNTPLASMRLNSAMLRREIGENTKLDRIEQSVENILALQSHLRSYLNNHALQKEEFYLFELLEAEVALLEKAYPSIGFRVISDEEITLFANKEAFMRILGNILSNAAKYNRQNGTVRVWLEDERLYIEDGGKGIQNPKRIFERFYKEQERGLGIGLHIVKKLCDELNIGIEVRSEIGKGSRFVLDIAPLILR